MGFFRDNLTMGRMVNPLTKLISDGKIETLDQLKSTYRTLVMKTHPDAVGSNKYVEGYLSLSSYYEEAKQVLTSRNGPDRGGKAVPRNHRLAYYQVLQRLELIDKPYSFHRQQNAKVIQALKAEARFHFGIWNARYEKLYADAEREYDRIKSETTVKFQHEDFSGDDGEPDIPQYRHLSSDGNHVLPEAGEPESEGNTSATRFGTIAVRSKNSLRC